MIGNVWEWTQSKFKDYPYNSTDGREDLHGDDRRVLRGGAFDVNQVGARCVYRRSSRPDLRYFNVGLRVVVSPGSRF